MLFDSQNAYTDVSTMSQVCRFKKASGGSEVRLRKNISMMCKSSITEEFTFCLQNIGNKVFAVALCCDTTAETDSMVTVTSV